MILIKNFVREYGELYGKESLVFNVHALIHIPKDVFRFGSLDEYSAFPFENKLQELKGMVRKSSQIITQIVHQLQLTANRSPNMKKRLHLFRAHMHGPLPNENHYYNAEQYRCVNYNNMFISCNKPDNCLAIGSDIILVMNVLKLDQSIYIVYKKYRIKVNYFHQPILSSRIGIHKVKQLSNQLNVANIDLVKSKLKNKSTTQRLLCMHCYNS